jgi:diguanylate cyclase (GGDEF)-like protein
MTPWVSIEWFEAGAAGIYLLFALIHFDLWLRRRGRMSHLWLAGASAGALLVDLSGIVLRRSPQDDVGRLLPTLNLLGVLIVTSSIFELVRSLTGARPARVAHASYAVLAASAFVIGYGGVQALPIYMICCGVLLLLAMLHAFQGARAGDPESRLIAAGLSLLILTLLIDILAVTQVIPLIPGLPIVGFVILFIVSARALSGRYEREYRELLALRNELEERVHERTHALEDANRRLEAMSRTDSLTGLLNRRAFLEECERELHRAARGGQPCSVVMIDLDHFKQINDRYGHGAGDELLKSGAMSLRSVLRAEDLVARWGGEEFVFFLPNTDADAAARVAEKARKTLAGMVPAGAGPSVSVTGSFGIATHRIGRTLEATIAAADQALYRAKETGRNRVVAED